MGSHLNNQQNNTCYNAEKKKKVRVLYRLMPPFYKRKKTHCANVTVSFETPIVYQFSMKLPTDLALINRAGGLHGRILTEVVCTIIYLEASNGNVHIME